MKIYVIDDIDKDHENVCSLMREYLKVMQKKPLEPSIKIHCNDGLQTLRLWDVGFFEVQEHNL